MGRSKQPTAKQTAFARNVATGMTLTDAYKTAYDAQNMSPASIRTEACLLAQRPNIAQIIERLRAKKDTAVIASSVSDKDRVLNKLRTLLDNAEGTPAEGVMLKAAQLLGSTQGMYRSVTVDETERETSDLEAELVKKLAAFNVPIPPDDDDQPTKTAH